MVLFEASSDGLYAVGVIATTVGLGPPLLNLQEALPPGLSFILVFMICKGASLSILGITDDSSRLNRRRGGGGEECAGFITCFHVIHEIVIYTVTCITYFAIDHSNFRRLLMCIGETRPCDICMVLAHTGHLPSHIRFSQVS